MVNRAATVWGGLGGENKGRSGLLHGVTRWPSTKKNWFRDTPFQQHNIRGKLNPKLKIDPTKQQTDLPTTFLQLCLSQLFRMDVDS